MTTTNLFPFAPIVFIDLDETLIDKDSNSLWLEWRIKHKRDFTGIPELLIALHNAFYYKKGKLTRNKMNIYFWARTLGISRDKYFEMCNTFFNEKGIHHIYSDAIKLIERIKDRCDYMVIITGQDDYLTYPFYSYLQFHDYISNKRITKNNKFIGFEKPNCYAEGKIAL
ncbi:MAG: HAD family hydrolase, partial [Candidatus Thorarchaeota archaeon]